MGRIAVLLAFVAACSAHAQDAKPPVSKHIAKIMARSDGLSEATAFKVSGVQDEYEIAAALGVKVTSQSLVLKKKAYDVLDCTDAEGKSVTLWFDINSFYPEF